jgi:hypothetical protein
MPTSAASGSGEPPAGKDYGSEKTLPRSGLLERARGADGRVRLRRNGVVLSCWVRRSASWAECVGVHAAMIAHALGCFKGTLQMNIALWVAVVGGLFSVVVVFVKKSLESRSSNIAVLAEIQRLLKVIERHKKFWEDCISKGETDLPLIPFSTPVFDEQVKSIGNIDRAVVAKVVAFYGYVKFINAMQSQKPNYTTASKGRQFNQQHLGILGNVLRDYKDAFDQEFSKYGLK